MSRNKILIAAGIVLLIVAGVVAYFVFGPSSSPATQETTEAPAASSGAGQAAPAPKVVVLDLTAVTQQSAVGRDIANQLQAYANQTKGQFAGRTQALEAEGRQLQNQLASLPPDQRQQRAAAFEAKQNALRGELQQQDARIRTAFAQAQGAMSKQLEPILKQVTAQHGANLVLDKRAVPMLDDPGMDITGEVLSQLNAKMPSYKVTIPPAAK